LFEYQKSPIRLIMKSNQPIIRKHLMEHINHTTLLIGIKDKQTYQFE
ncbi:transposase, partial [Streptococcus mutans NFSM1]